MGLLAWIRGVQARPPCVAVDLRFDIDVQYPIWEDFMTLELEIRKKILRVSIVETMYRWISKIDTSHILHCSSEFRLSE